MVSICFINRFCLNRSVFFNHCAMFIALSIIESFKRHTAPLQNKTKDYKLQLLFQMVVLLIFFKLQRTVLVGVWSSAVVTDMPATRFPDVQPFYLCCCSVKGNPKCDKSQFECCMDVLKAATNYSLVAFLVGQPGLREAISMSCITNGSTGSRKTSHSPAVPIARKETLSSAAKRYFLFFSFFFKKRRISPQNMICLVYLVMEKFTHQVNSSRGPTNPSLMV